MDKQLAVETEQAINGIVEATRVMGVALLGYLSERKLLTWAEAARMMEALAQEKPGQPLNPVASLILQSIADDLRHFADPKTPRPERPKLKLIQGGK